MKAVENHCVDCGLPCLGSRCSKRNVVVFYCDMCGERAEYRLDHLDMCSDCAKAYIGEIWDNLAMSEKANLLNVPCLNY